jgi:hypothetical protein
VDIPINAVILARRGPRFVISDTGNGALMAQTVEHDLATDLARELQLEGSTVRVVESIPQQRVIDVIWAAKRAGRLIGEQVRTSVTQLTERPDGDVAVLMVVHRPAPEARPAPAATPEPRPLVGGGMVPQQRRH